MPLPNIFSLEISNQLIDRINTLSPTSKALWGKMNAPQMLAHCNVTYEIVFDNIHPKPNAIIKFVLKLLVKNKVVSEAPYTQNGQTAPQFIIKTNKDFEVEKCRLIDFIKQSQSLGEAYFNNKASDSFGVLSATEWNNMFYKHLHHHLNQFGV